ncbi:hypothetical protein Tco_1280240 [Tanacetum coccineum]
MNWIDASVFPIFVPWYNDVSVKRDPLTSDDVVDLPLMDKLNENCHDKDDMGLLDFVKSVDPLNVKVGERTLAEGEVPLLTETIDMVVVPSAQIVRLMSHTIVDELKESTGKRKGKLVSVLFVSFSDTLTPKRDCQDESVYVHDENVRTLPASDGFVVLTSSSEPADTDTLTSSQVASPTLHVQSETEAVAIGLVNEARSSYTIDSATAHEIYVPNWDVTNDARMDDLIMCRNLIDHVPPPGYWASLYHNKGKGDFMNISGVPRRGGTSVMDAEIVDLKSRLERAKSGAVEVGTLRGQVSKPEVAPAAKAEEFTGLTVQNSELLGQVSGLESIRDSLKERVAQLESDCECLRGKVKGEAKLKEQFMAMKDVEIQRLMEHGSDLDARLSELIYQLDYELYLHMLTIVAGRRWVIGHGFRLAFMKCCQSLDYHTALAK